MHRMPRRVRLLGQSQRLAGNQDQLLPLPFRDDKVFTSRMDGDGEQMVSRRREHTSRQLLREENPTRQSVLARITQS